MRPAATVIVPCRDHAAALGRCLDGLRNQDTTDPFEVLVVDDGSRDPLFDSLVEPFRLIRQPAFGPAAARNAAARQARGRIAIFVNADAVIPPDFVRRHLEAHAELGPATAILGRFDHFPDQNTPLMQLADRLGLWFDYAAVQNLAPAALPWTFFWTGNLSLPFDLLRAAGGFEERFVRPIWEDIELGYRLARRGVPLHFADIPCGHDHPMDLDALLTRAEWMGHQWVTFARLHGGAPFPILGGQDEPDDRFAHDLLSGLCHQYLRHTEREAELKALIAASPDALDDSAADLLVGLNTVARMSGILGGITGHTPPEIADYRNKLHHFDVVHTIADANDLPLTERMLDVLPKNTRLIVAHRSWLATDHLPKDERILPVRLDDSHDRWKTLLDTSDRAAFVFLDGQPLPSRTEIENLVFHLGVSPRIAAVGLGERCGLRYTAAALVDSLPTHAIALPRHGLAALTHTTADRTSEPETLLGKILARRLPLAVVIPAGAAVG